MKSKKMPLVACVLALAIGITACTTGQPTHPPTAPQTEQPGHNGGYDYYYENEPTYETERYNHTEFHDENVMVSLSFDSPGHTLGNIINIFAEITNISEETLIFQVGSGSNLVPDALTVQVGALTPLFIPGIMTMDMQTGALEPGETIKFELPFAPYTYVGEGFAWAPPDSGIEYFSEGDEWEAVPSGEIAGTMAFSYVISADDEFFMITEEDTIITLEGSFTLTLDEAAVGGNGTDHGQEDADTDENAEDNNAGEETMEENDQ